MTVYFWVYDYNLQILES